MKTLGLVVVAIATTGCGSDDGGSNNIGEATVSGAVMGASIDSGAIAWRATISGTSSSLIAMHETGVACDPDISSGNTLVLQFSCALESGSFTVVTDGSGACPNMILATLEDDGEDLAFGSGGTISLDVSDTGTTGSFDIDFGEESLGGSFNLRDCGELTLD